LVLHVCTVLVLIFPATCSRLRRLLNFDRVVDERCMYYYHDVSVEWISEDRPTLLAFQYLQDPYVVVYIIYGFFFKDGSSHPTKLIFALFNFLM
jgi:rRNA maturation protein Rpf1